MQIDEQEAERDNTLEMKYIQYSSLDNIRKMASALRKEVDLYYPAQTPAQRIGHYLARDILSIVGLIQTNVDENKKQISDVKNNDDSWFKYFPAGSRLDFTPFQVYEFIEQREAQIEKLQIELCKLQRRTNRLLETRVRE